MIATNPHDQQRVVHVRDLWKSFDQKQVLRGVNLDVHSGENVIVLGRSGTGKSVLIKILAGLLAADAGTVEVFGHDMNTIRRADLAALRLQIGFLFQQGALYDSLTVRENLEFSLVRHIKGLKRSAIDKDVHAVLEAVGLPQTLEQYPSELSGGQAKRVAIARMLILKPRLILYDEPTAGLDPITSTEINQLIVEVKERYQASSILITHDLTCARQTGDRVMMLDHGQFIRQGSFDEVFKEREGTIRSFYDYNFIT